jgi:hypothetical protein
MFLQGFWPPQQDLNMRAGSLEALKMSSNNKLNNGFKVLRSDVAYVPRSVALSGM